MIQIKLCYLKFFKLCNFIVNCLIAANDTDRRLDTKKAKGVKVLIVSCYKNN